MLLFGQDLNLYSFVGTILLIGIVKKNAIMIVDFALAAERNTGVKPEEAIYEGCLQRFRPIMMTTMAALLGAGAADCSWQWHWRRGPAPPSVLQSLADSLFRNP